MDCLCNVQKHSPAPPHRGRGTALTASRRKDFITTLVKECHEMPSWASSPDKIRKACSSLGIMRSPSPFNDSMVPGLSVLPYLAALRLKSVSTIFTLQEEHFLFVIVLFYHFKQFLWHVLFESDGYKGDLYQ